ncbi:hypothetical protein PQQ72_06790 [Paraburkholderia strydomiana]|uniref:Uncharacterized protein n=1 Tax=Paraburkholderia caledonica TaxID=134536 RepID=A0AB73I9S9_9BURK|nr:hypothetical protein [Paraburkholderia caledonica]
MNKTLNHPLEYNATARAYFESLTVRASKGGVAVWREAVEQLTGGLPSWARRKLPARGVKTAAPAVRTAE